MISTKRAMSILSENNPEKRNEMIDKLKEEDAKYLLKICFAVTVSYTHLTLPTTERV